MANTWMGPRPTQCQLCHRDLKHQFVDGKTKGGFWAIMCIVCHKVQGFGFGLGKGQRYDLVSLEKIDG